MAKVCPQRIIAEAIRIIEELWPESNTTGALDEAVINNIMELDGLEKALYRDGIINIEEWKG